MTAGTVLHWKEIKPGDLILWPGSADYSLQQLQLGGLVDLGMEPLEQVTGIDYGTAIMTMNRDYRIGCEDETTFEVVRRQQRQEAYGIVIEIFEDGSVRIDGKRHGLLTPEERERIP